MADTLNLPSHLTGLTDREVEMSRAQHGINLQYHGAKNTWWKIIVDILKDPMLIILFSVAAIYFFLGEWGEAYFMLGAILLVSGISFYQDNRSRIALETIQALTAPFSQVIRNRVTVNIPTEEIVPGDLVIASEGSFINADGMVKYSHDFSVNESALTGEASAVYKSEDHDDSKVYSGTMVSSGLAVYEVGTTGISTKLGQLSTSLSTIKEQASPLQMQITSFVKKMSIAGIVVFLLVCVFQYMQSKDLLDSLLKGLTLAMSVLPEEIPVAFTTFMALGARRLIREGILVKKTRTVETLGNASVICVDKTGTITENKMTLQGLYDFRNKSYNEEMGTLDDGAQQVIEAAMWASEPVPFDPMEITIHQLYAPSAGADRRLQFTMIHEYALGGVPPMMTHVYQDEHLTRIIAAKGAPEAILNVSVLTAEEHEILQEQITTLASKGYRILGVAVSDFKGDEFPKTQQELSFRFLGLLAFFDPPKKNITDVFNKFYDAGIQVKIITGDNAITTTAIARDTGLRNAEKAIDGEELMKMDEVQKNAALEQYTIFTRMFPEAKLSAVQSLKEIGHIVAMVGDGVNDGPALKASHIGIAMGKKGTEIAKNSAALVLVNDDLSKMIDAIATGRRIYTNLKKAVQYIISIHIPIITTVSLPLFLGWIYPSIFTPVHVIFLELVMGPTCSIVYENEPIEKNAMKQPPRPVTYSFLNWKEMSMSILQGLMIAAGILFVYQYAVRTGGDEATTRTMAFMTLIVSNIFLTLVNRSFYYSVFQTLRHHNRLILIIIGITLLMLLVMLMVPFARDFFKLTVLSPISYGVCILVAAASVFWFEGWKWWRRRQGEGAYI